MLFTLTIIGQFILLLTSIWMLKTWLPKEGVQGWFSAVFCSGLLIGSFSGSYLLAQVIDLTPMFWFEQLALYAAFPFLSFVLLALAFQIDWPKEAWGRILLGVCGIYWLCQQTQTLDFLLSASALISSLAIIKLLLNANCLKQAGLLFLIAASSSIVVAANSFSIEIITTYLPLELALGLLLVVINRTLYLKIKIFS